MRNLVFLNSGMSRSETVHVSVCLLALTRLQQFLETANGGRSLARESSCTRSHEVRNLCIAGERLQWQCKQLQGGVIWH